MNAEVSSSADLMLRCHEARELEAMGIVAASTAPEIEALLGPVIRAMERLRQARFGTDRNRRELARAVACGERMRVLLRHQMNFARVLVPGRGEVDLASLLEDVRDLLGSVLGPVNVLSIEVAAGLAPVITDRRRLTGVLLHLTADARDAMRQGGTLTIAVGRPSAADTLDWLDGENPICVSVSHTGAGLDEHTLMHVTSPSYLGDPAGNGAGLGLSAIGSVVVQLGGHVTVSSSPGEGTAVKLLLPSS